MMCEHCMEEAMPDSTDMMTFDTFDHAVRFGVGIGCNVFILSGGEPTENPDLFKFCDFIDQLGLCGISICSNGMFLKDPQKTEMIRKITGLRSLIGIQVYSNKKWYREYDYIVENKARFQEISRKIVVDLDSPIYMRDLGRARKSPAAQEEVAKSPYHMSCLNCSLLARQTNMQTFGIQATLLRRFCFPSVDANGFVRLSESRTCPSVGNVLTDTPEQIFDGMQHFQPCGNCAGYRKFAASNDQKIIESRRILGL